MINRLQIIGSTHFRNADADDEALPSQQYEIKPTTIHLNMHYLNNSTKYSNLNLCHKCNFLPIGERDKWVLSIHPFVTGYSKLFRP